MASDGVFFGLQRRAPSTLLDRPAEDCAPQLRSADRVKTGKWQARAAASADGWILGTSPRTTAGIICWSRNTSSAGEARYAGGEDDNSGAETSMVQRSTMMRSLHLQAGFVDSVGIVFHPPARTFQL